MYPYDPNRPPPPPWYPPPPQVVVYNNNVQRPPSFSHGIHIVLDVLTCGAWLPFHLLIWLCS